MKVNKKVLKKDMMATSPLQRQLDWKPCGLFFILPDQILLLEPLWANQSAVEGYPASQPTVHDRGQTDDEQSRYHDDKTIIRNEDT